MVGRVAEVVTARRIGEDTNADPCWYRRRIPAHSMGVHTSVPEMSHFCGNDDTSPWNRYRRLVTCTSPFNVHVRPAASAKLVVPVDCAVKSGLATAEPAMPLSSWNALIRPAQID